MDRLLKNERFIVIGNWKTDRLLYQQYRPDYPVLGQKGTIVRDFKMGDVAHNNEYAVRWDSSNIEERGDGDLIRHWMIKRISVRVGDRVKQIGNHDESYSPYCIITSVNFEDNGNARIGHRHDRQFETRWLEDDWENIENSFELINNGNIYVKGNVIKSKLNGEKGIITRVIDNNVYANWEKDRFLEFYLNKEDVEIIEVKNET